MRSWILRGHAGGRIPWLPIAALLYFAGALAVPPSARAQDINEIISSNLRDLKSKNALVRTQAASSLGNNASPGSPAYDREQTRKAVPALMEALKDTDPSVRMAAAFALGNIPGDMRIAVPALIQTLQDIEPQVREEAARSLGRIGQSPELAVPALAGELKRNGTRRFAMDALIKFGPAAQPAVPALIAMLKENDPNLPWYVAQVLGAIGPQAQDAEPALLELLRGADDQNRLEAADALAKIGRDQPEAVLVVTPLLEAADAHDRMRGAAVLGDLALAAEPSIPALTKALSDENDDVRGIAATSLSKIAQALRDAGRTGAIEPLQNAAAAMEQSPDSRVKANAHRSIQAITALQNIRRHDVKWQLLRPVHEHPRVVFVIGAYLALAFLWSCLLWLWPLSLLKVSEALQSVPKVSLPGWLGGMQISVSHLLLVGFFSQSDWVLDAWVVKHLETARASFASNTATKYTDLVPGPMLLDRELLPALSVGALRPAFARPKTRILIWGSSDNRNTNLACEIARWSMELDPQKRVCKNLMIAVRVTQNFDYTAEKDADPFLSTVRDKLQLDEEAPSVELVARLLERQRVLVIVLGLSELNDSTQSSIQPAHADFSANALLVTSKIEKALGGATTTVIRFSEEIPF